MSYVYCNRDRRGTRWFYHETEGFRDKVPGSSSFFRADRVGAYEFASKEEAWAHCRERRKGSRMMSGSGTWIVVKVRDSAPPLRSET
jgi:hypothetical protein